MRALLDRRWLPLAFGALLVALWAPLVASPLLPFHDASGLVGLAGALAHADEPAARIAAFYELDLGLFPSVLYFGWGWLAGAVGMPMHVAYALFTALFCVGGVPASAWLLLRAFRRPPALALLAFPVAYHQQVWFGFLGSAAAVNGLVAALACAKLVVDDPRPRHHVGLAAALLFVAAAHPFPFALTLAIVAPVLVWPRPAGGEGWAGVLFAARAACFLPAALFLAPWAAGFFGGGAGGGEGASLRRIRRALRPDGAPLAADLESFLRWLGDGYAAAWDETLPALALASVAAFLVAGIRAPASPAAREPRPEAPRAWLWLAWAALVLALGSLLLPTKLLWPNFWWGARQRCVLPLFLVALAGVRPARRGLPPLALAPAALAALLYAGYVTFDFAATWRGRALAGFEEAIAAIPPGRSVLAFPDLAERHYTRGHPYLVQHYVARAGGYAVPGLQGHRGSYWVTPKPPPPHPAWGDSKAFVWQEHAAGFEYFLVEAPTDGPPLDLAAAAPAGAVELVREAGRFRVYRKLRD